MYPPEFLIPFKLLGWKSFPVEEVEYSTILFVPSIFQGFERSLHCLFNQLGTVEPNPKIHDKPHRFDTVSRIDRSALEGVRKRSVTVYIFNDQSSQFRTEKHLHHFMNALFDDFFQELFLEKMFNLHR